MLPAVPSVTARPASPPAQAQVPAPAQSCVSQVFDGLTQAQRVGQLFQVGIANDPSSEVAKAVQAYHFGSVLYVGTNTAGVAAVQSRSAALQAQAARATGGVRFFIAANQEGGQIQQLRGPGFSAIPSAVQQGQLPASVLAQQAVIWGGELAAAGVNLDLAPVLDVVPQATRAQNQPIGVLDREFGSAPAPVASHGVAFIQGMAQAGIATTAKHFPGLGRVRGNTDFSSDVVDSATGPDDPNLRSFQSAIDAGVPFVLVSLATYTRIDPDHLAAFSPVVMRGLLRQRMHFGGVIMSDDLGEAAAVAAVPPGTRAIDFLAAGGDMIISATLPAAVAMVPAVLHRAEADPAFRADVDAAVKRILTAKQAYHLLPC